MFLSREAVSSAPSLGRGQARLFTCNVSEISAPSREERGSETEGREAKAGVFRAGPLGGQLRLGHELRDGIARTSGLSRQGVRKLGVSAHVPPALPRAAPRGELLQLLPCSRERLSITAATQDSRARGWELLGAHPALWVP